MNKDFITFLSSTNRDEGSICSKIWNTKGSTILETQSGWKFGCKYTWCCCILSVGATRCSKNGKDFSRFFIRLESDIAHTIGFISYESYQMGHIIWIILYGEYGPYHLEKMSRTSPLSPIENSLTSEPTSTTSPQTSPPGVYDKAGKRDGIYCPALM